MWEEYVNYKTVGNYHHPYFRNSKKSISKARIVIFLQTTSSGDDIDQNRTGL